MNYGIALKEIIFTLFIPEERKEKEAENVLKHDRLKLSKFEQRSAHQVHNVKQC